MLEHLERQTHLTGNQRRIIAAAVLGDAVIRLIPGVLGDDNSAADDSFSAGQNLEAPQYTRPAEFRGMKVPDVLLSGNHAAIAKWRAEQGLVRTRRNRPDLLSGSAPSAEDGREWNQMRREP